MMRTFLVLTCCFALTGLVRAEEQDNEQDQSKKPKKFKQTTTTTVNPTGGAGEARKFQTLSNASRSNVPAVQSNTNVPTKGPGEAEAYTAEGASEKTSQFKKQKNWNASNFKTGTGDLPAVQSNTNVQTSNNAQFKKLKIRKEWDSNSSNGVGDVPAVQTNQEFKKQGKYQKGSDPRQHYLGTGETDAPNNSRWKGKNWSKQGGNAKFQGQVNANKAWKIKKFSSLHRNPGVPRVQFSTNARIFGSDKWQGNQYNAFRIYSSQRHDRNWWRSRHNRIVLAGGGHYYWDNGYWYPAWGYDPDSEFYAYDGPIYGYDGLPPDQVIANVQAALQEQGYYQGEVDGLLGPLTRAALAGYQRDNGLYTTSAIDQPTLESLGMT